MPASLDVLLRQLHQLKELRDSGALSEEGYERRAAELLSGKTGEVEAPPPEETGASDRGSSWSAKPSVTASTGGRVKGGSALTATPLGTAANSTVAPRAVPVKPPAEPGPDLASTAETAPDKTPALRLSGRSSRSAWVAEPAGPATDLPGTKGRADKKSGRNRDEHLRGAMDPVQPATSSAGAPQAVEQSFATPPAPSTRRQRRDPLAKPSERWAATPGSAVSGSSVEEALSTERPDKAKKSRWRKSAKYPPPAEALPPPVSVDDARLPEETEARESLGARLAWQPETGSLKDEAPRFSASPGEAQPLTPTSAVAPSPDEETVPSKSAKPRTRTWRKGRITEAPGMIEEPSTSFEQSSETTLEASANAMIDGSFGTTIDETLDVAIDREEVSEEVEAAAPILEDPAVGTVAPTELCDVERSDPEVPAIADVGPSDETSVLAGDLEWRRQSFLPKQRRSNVEVEHEVHDEPSDLAEVAVPVDPSPEPLEVQELPRGDGSGSYWDISTRVVPDKGGLLGNDEESTGKRHDTYWRKTRRRY